MAANIPASPPALVLLGPVTLQVAGGEFTKQLPERFRFVVGGPASLSAGLHQALVEATRAYLASLPTH